MQEQLGIIASHWANLDLLDFQGIHLPNDTLIPLEVTRRGRIREVILRPPIALADLAPAVLEYWDGAAVLCELTTDDLLIQGGERASHGSCGFVAVSRLQPSGLLWIAGFDWSNPFDQLELLDNRVQATSTSGEIWQLSLTVPPVVSVVRGWED